MRSAAAGAALVPAGLRGVPVHGEARGAAAAGTVPPDAEALIVALGRVHARRREQPRAEVEITAAEDHILAALLCLAAADERKQKVLAR